MSKFRDHFPDHDLTSITPEEVLSFLTSLNGECKQLTKHTRYAYLKALFNFIRNNLEAQLQNPCDTPMLKKLFRPGKLVDWQVQEKETIDEVVFIPKKLTDRLKDYLKARGAEGIQRIFPITYTAARVMVKKAGALVGVHLRPHDLRHHAATFASRSRVPLKIVSKVIMRHANLSTTQRYLGKVSDVEAVRWIENLYR